MVKGQAGSRVDAAPLMGFPPAGADEPRVLVLGSFPSVQSLELGRYYGHGRNHFWALMAACLGTEVPDDYANRVDMLRAAGIALWDAAASCERRGSLDQDMARVVPNDVAGYVRGHPTVLRVALNGTKAAELFARHGAPELRGAFGRVGEEAAWRPDPASPRVVMVVRMPSTSPVHSGRYRRMEDKLPAWRGFLGRA